MDGLEFLSLLPGAAIPVAFLDPQYRGVLEKLKYGNEGELRGKRRAALAQMTAKETIVEFIRGIDRALCAVRPFVPVDRQVPKRSARIFTAGSTAPTSTSSIW